MSIPIFASTLLSPPTVVSAEIDGSDQLVMTITRGSTEPDWSHYHIYISATGGIDITDPGSYDVMLQSLEGNVVDLGPWTPPLHIVMTEVAYDGEESAASAEFDIEAVETELLSLRTVDETVLGFDGGSGSLGTFGDNDGTTEVTVYLYNAGDATMVITYPPTVSGDATDATGTVGDVILAPGEQTGIVLALDTSTPGAAFSVGLSVTTDGADTPFTFTLGYEVEAGPLVEELTIQDVFGVQVGATGLDGSSATVGPFTENGSTTSVVYRLYNSGEAALTMDYGTLAISGDGGDADPSDGLLTLDPGEFAEFTIAFDTGTAQVGRSVGISFGHTGADTPYTYTLNFDVEEEAAPEPDTFNSRIFREARFGRHTRV